jgi:hypothetical protein
MVIRIKKMRARKTPPKNPSPRKVKQKMTKGNNSKKLNLLNDIEVRDTKPGLVNYCIPAVLSRCGAGTNWEAQKRCKFAEKSIVSNRCMYYVESIDGHCDCVEAQSEQRDKEGSLNHLNGE